MAEGNITKCNKYFPLNKFYFEFFLFNFFFVKRKYEMPVIKAPDIYVYCVRPDVSSRTGF